MLNMAAGTIATDKQCIHSHQSVFTKNGAQYEQTSVNPTMTGRTAEANGGGEGETNGRWKQGERGRGTGGGTNGRLNEQTKKSTVGTD